jgi:hypothetical protein
MKFNKGHTRAAKLTGEQVYQLRLDYVGGMTQGELCHKYQISIGQVGRIVRGESWQAFHNPAEVATGVIPPIMQKSDEQIQTEADASLARVMERMQADITKAREKPLDSFLNDEARERAKGYLGEKDKWVFQINSP